MKTSFSYNIYVYIVVLLPFIFCELSFSEISNRGAISWLLLLFYLGFIISHYKILRKDKSKIILFSFFYIILQLVYMSLSPSLPEKYNLYNKLFYVQFAFCGLTFWILGYKKIPIHDKYLQIVVNALILIMCYYTLNKILSMDYVNLFGTQDEMFFFVYQILPYMLLWLFLPLFLNDSFITRYIIGGILFILLIVMLKRGPLVSFSLAAIGIFLARKKLVGVRLFAIVALITIVITVAIYYFYDSFQFLGERFQGGENGDISNNRLGMWGIFIQNWINQDPIYMIFGNGFESSHVLMFRNGQNAKGAHNDFLELLYCYGVFGFLIFFMLVYVYYKNMRLAAKVNYRQKDLIIASFVIFICTSFYSSNLTRFSTVFFGMYFYYAVGEMQRDLVKQRNKKLLKNIINAK